ncbi:ABC transporter permease [Actinomadura sp. NEAU-AAG7]|uniref:ABC transporter permease n=1 Tax=Actinomadura sp. NEAU-AAG7 TaxID=2839640 RepID=UPI001BE468E8|nr:ABC transporter permease [Actinomadura sp. NEAU-AAG7]MBT2213284.1 ABC transporter permease [Actinomadura sp. NEAU-AAG7]
MTAVTLAPAPAAGEGGRLAGTGMLVKMWLRRDRIMLPAWIYALTALVSSSMYSFRTGYDEPGALEKFARGINDNPSTKAMYGPVLNEHTASGVAAWQTGATGAALVGLMCVLLVVRHSRAEEETGRLELVGAGVVGRRAPLTAALLVAATAAGTLAVLATAVMIAFGAPAAGAVAFGLAWFGAGMVFAGVAAVTAQVAQTSRLANGLALAVLGTGFLLRGLGDVGSAHWLAWLSPIGWAQRVRPYADEQWAALALPLVAFALLAAAAYALIERRDLGAGILAPGPGPSRAAPSLRTPLALAWRLQRGSLVGWSAGFLVYGLAIGGIADGVSDLVGDSDSTLKSLRELGRQDDIVDAFLSTAMGLMALLTAAYAVQGVLRLRAEEAGQRLEPVLATGVGRLRWAVSQLAVTVAGTVVMLALTGLAVGSAHGLRSGDLDGQLPRVFGAALAQLPAVWVVAGVTVLLFGLLPRAAQAGWGVLAVCLMLGQMGPVLKLPQPVMDVSPFTHTPNVPGGTFSPLPLASLTAVALAASAAGLLAFRRRDIG